MAKRRVFGKVRQLPSGRWQARYLSPDGTYLRAPQTYATKGEADTYLAGIQTDQARGNWLDPRKGTTLLSAYGEAWIETRTVRGRPLRPRSAANHRFLLKRHILPVLGDLPLDKITPQAVRLWHAEVLKVGQTTAAQAYRTLHAILATATVDGTYARNPCQIRGAGANVAPRRPLVTPHEMVQLAGQMPEHLQALVHLAFWGGLRLGELLGLEFRDLHLDVEAGTGFVRVERQQQDIDGQPVTGPPKADSVRTVHLPAPAVAVLAAHVESAGRTHPTARVFTRASGDVLRQWDVQRYWSKARREAGLREELAKVHLHDLRHGGLTLFTQHGASLADVMARAGHSSAAAAMIYQHAAESRDEELAARMNSALDGSSAESSGAPGGSTEVVQLRLAASPREAKRIGS